MTHELAILGAGNMGAAIVRGIIEAGILPAADILVVEPDEARRRAMADLGCATGDDVGAARPAERIMLAVKPQLFAAVAEALAPLPKSTVVISIMAGLSSGRIRAALGDAARVVRVMPNTPCQIGMGMAGIALEDGARDGDEAFAMRIFDALGRAERVEEAMMHAVTAVSGSGPAYVYLLAEAMQQAAEQMGLPHRQARTFVQQTILGAGELLGRTDGTATELRQAVTSPGGTTAAALEVMFEQELPEIVVEAMLAARQRSEELDAG